MEKRSISLDVRSERDFVALIHKHYRRVQINLTGSDPLARDAVSRSADYYEYRWYHKNLHYEARWRITDSLHIAHATQIVIDNSWSLLDVVAYTILMLKTGAEWWETLHYFGDAILVAELSVQNLEPVRGSARTIHQVVRP